MITAKKYLKTKNVCKVTFKVPKAAAKKAQEIALVGEFNNWNPKEGIMTALKDGSFKQTVELKPGKGYAFRYLHDGEKWENDWAADAYISSGVCPEENGIVDV